MSAPINDDNPTNGDGSGGDWHSSVAQSFRSSEVRSIAKVLASLEPGATSASKAMLAMRFEESIFKAASDLDDYRKTIQKRLKRLQKHYAKQQQAGGGEGGGDDKAQNPDMIREKERLLESELRDEYGERLLYIAEHADEAIAKTREKIGDNKKADILKQHCDNAILWAVHLGLQLPQNCKSKNVSHARQEKRDMEFLEKLKKYLEGRVDNIRSHIVKLVDTDKFLEEELVKIDDHLLKEKVTEVFQKALERADNEDPQFTEERMKELLERMDVAVPIPRRNQDGERIKSAVARIEKVRAATQALYTYVGLSVGDKTKFGGSLVKCHAVAIECLKELEVEYNHLVKELDDKDENGKRIIRLEDAWNNPMQFLALESSDETETPALKEDASGEDGADGQ